MQRKGENSGESALWKMSGMQGHGDFFWPSASLRGVRRSGGNKQNKRAQTMRDLRQWRYRHSNRPSLRELL